MPATLFSMLSTYSVAPQRSGDTQCYSYRKQCYQDHHIRYPIIGELEIHVETDRHEYSNQASNPHERSHHTEYRTKQYR